MGGLVRIIQVSKEEVKYLRKNVKDIKISKTVHKYYVPELTRVVKALEKYKEKLKRGEW